MQKKTFLNNQLIEQLIKKKSQYLFEKVPVNNLNDPIIFRKTTLGRLLPPVK